MQYSFSFTFWVRKNRNFFNSSTVFGSMSPICAFKFKDVQEINKNGGKIMKFLHIVHIFILRLLAKFKSESLNDKWSLKLRVLYRYPEEDNLLDFTNLLIRELCI